MKVSGLRQENWPAFRQRLKDGLPKAAFNLSLFVLVWVIFDSKFGFIVAATSTAFSSNLKKRLTVVELILLASTQMIACSFACMASLNIVSRLVLNILFPLVWTLLCSSAADNSGYFVGVITFVFIQLIPFTRDEIGYLFAVETFAVAAMTGTFAILKLFEKKQMDDSVLRNGLRTIAAQLRTNKANINTLLDTEYLLYRRAYSGHNILHLYSRGEHIYYIFALIFQRAVYFFTDHKRTLIKGWMDEPRKELADFLMRAADEINQHDNTALIVEAERLLKKGLDFPEEFGSIYRNILRLLVLALKEMPQKGAYKEHFKFKVYLQDLRNHFQLNDFQFRFALRLSIVMTICFAVMDLSDAEYVYWIAMNAFLITRPMYDESVSLVQSRLIGSVLGCAATYLFYMLVPAQGGLYVYYAVMTTCMHVSTPGKWARSFFATSCGVALASISLGGNAAVAYRLLYLGIATALVFLVNRFIFPSTRRRQNDYYLRDLFKMQKFYLNVLRQSLTHKVSLTILHNALVNFHVLCDDLRKGGIGEYFEDLQYFLLCLWRMMAASEQMIVAMNTADFSKEEREWTAKWIDEVSEKLEARSVFDPNEIRLHEMPDKHHFTHLADRYQQNLSAVLRMASWTKLMPESHRFCHSKTEKQRDMNS